MGERLNSEVEAVAAIADAAQTVTINGIYRHYKDTSKHYRVLGFTLNKTEDQIDVLYRPQYGARLLCNRLLAEWVELVEYAGGMVPRYELVETTPDELGRDQADGQADARVDVGPDVV